jgi:hypothetical protein
MSNTYVVNSALKITSLAKPQVYQIGIVAALLALSLVGCASPAQIQANRDAEQAQANQEYALAIRYLTQADVAQCEYDAYLASANTRGILMPYAVGAQAKEMCLRAHLAARIAGQ